MVSSNLHHTKRITNKVKIYLSHIKINVKGYVVHKETNTNKKEKHSVLPKFELKFLNSEIF